LVAAFRPVIAVVAATPDFHALRSQRRGHEAVLYAFDLIEQDGEDLRAWPLLARKRWLKKLVGKAKRPSIQFVEHLTGDGPTIFEHVCRMGLEGIVSKRTDAPYRSGPSKTWLKSKNPASEAVRRGSAEESGGSRRSTLIRKRKAHRLLRLIVALLLTSASNAVAADLIGQASIIDGDTLEIHGTRIRLWGIDAPESSQLCRGEDFREVKLKRGRSMGLASEDA
jgi:ATP dependent DNA ligase domain